MNSPPSSSPSSLPSFDVFWHTKNLLLPLETPTRSTRLSYTQEFNNQVAVGGTKRNSTLATLPSPTILSRVGSTTSSSNEDIVSELKGRTRVNKRTRRTISNNNKRGKDEEIGLDEDTLKTLGVLAARLSSSASTSRNSLINKGSSLPPSRIGGSSNKVVDGNGGSRSLGRSLTSDIVSSTKGKERQVLVANIEKVSTKRSNETHSSTSILAPTERLLPASLTKFRASTSMISTTSKLNLPVSNSKLLPLLSKTLPPSRTSTIITSTTATTSTKKDEFDDYFNSADDEFFELALSQLEAESIAGGSSAIKKPLTTANSRSTNVKPVQAQVGIPPGRILVPPTRASPRFGSGNTTIPFNATTTTTLTSNNYKSSGNKILPTSLPPPRSIITTKSTVNVGISRKSNTSAITTTTTTLKSENSFRFSGPATRAAAFPPSKPLPLNPVAKKPSTVSMGKPNIRSNSNNGLKGLAKSTSLKEKKEMEELLRLEMQGLEEMGCVDDWSDGEF